MTPDEQLEVDMAEMEQLVLNPTWKVVERRVNQAIESFTEAVLVAPLAEKEALCQRVLAYKELLELPKTILDQFKQLQANRKPE